MPGKDEVSVDAAALEQLPSSSNGDAPAHLELVVIGPCDATCALSCWTKTCNKTCGITG
jgi:hypothetical protein